MKIVILDGHAVNPGDLSWEPLRGLGDLEVFDRTTEDAISARAREAEALLTTRVPLVGTGSNRRLSRRARTLGIATGTTLLLN
jgi:hypothetical protein